MVKVYSLKVIGYRLLTLNLNEPKATSDVKPRLLLRNARR